MAPSTSKAGRLSCDIIKHIIEILERAESDGLEYHLYGVLNNIFSRVLQEQNLKLVKFSVLRLFLYPQYQLLYIPNPDDISSSKESSSIVNTSSGTGSGDTPDSGSSQKAENASKAQDSQSKGKNKEDSEASIAVKKHYQIPDFAVLADNSSCGQDRTSHVEFIPFLIEAKSFGKTDKKGKPTSLASTLQDSMPQIFRQAKANFDTYPMQQHVHIFCVFGRSWKMLRFERTVLTQVAYEHDDAEYKPGNQRPDDAVWNHKIISYATDFHPLLNEKGNDIHQLLRRQITGCLNQYKELKAQQKQVNAEIDA